ncbi:protoporphyrinogen oxidase HemJ [Methylosinus sp. Sm6]|uniref:protoporphyrinogen oxidase HemJ n=1 Tax=Methylosinus sp. Sm6 TaxID=2866948 RepID=UPI001C992DED|nr:protoporphyrinogen oxidase HemJ [Methylosinus sp. Sm6]MBY6241803.1 protoporphyrinogen oxidase HemJ [Methylosinus sp. Sm6]
MYLWIKALHVIAIIAWMAALLYLPRLFVNHAEVGTGPQAERFKKMERGLVRIIMAPAMGVAWLAGLALIYLGEFRGAGWLHAKLALVVLLTAAHFYFGYLTRVFARDGNTRPAGFYRAINELPTVLMIGIVILVIVKPF